MDDLLDFRDKVVPDDCVVAVDDADIADIADKGGESEQADPSERLGHMDWAADMAIRSL